MTEKDGQIVRILMVEDNPDDAFLTKEALAETRMMLALDVVEDGVKAMAYLRKEPPYEDVLRPDLILLDLNMPKKDGRQVLAEIKSDSNLKAIPVVILTTSQAEGDIARAYLHHANSYVTKPVDLDAFIRVVKVIEEFWLTIVKLPPTGKN